LGPHSRRLSLGSLDLRTAEGRFAKGIRDKLAEHLGNQLTAPQELIISACAIKALRLELMVHPILSDAALANEGYDHRFLAWANSLRRDLEAIGIVRPPQLPRLGDYLKAIENTPAAAPEEGAAPGKDVDDA
jgi:hypothetical protein